jgi:hypothetical protein
MDKRWLWFLKYILVILTAFLAGMGATIWHMMRQ